MHESCCYFVCRISHLLGSAPVSTFLTVMQVVRPPRTPPPTHPLSSHVPGHETSPAQKLQRRGWGVPIVVGVHLPRLCYSRGCRWLKEGRGRMALQTQLTLMESRREERNLIFLHLQEMPWLGEWRIKWIIPAAASKFSSFLMPTRLKYKEKKVRFNSIRVCSCLVPRTWPQPLWGLVLVTFC